ncbi:uncharacterized protein LOC143288471 [Babylonia areolata]|uniref:uncharacterized protein LOC143288471 n=1 Tax=Babylonia areolata TaxID=304850 RepID=UPI003FD18938
MLKAFIGSNYLTIAFAFHKSGLGLGLAGVLLIASLTAHCCNLLVKCKYHAIQLLLLENREKGSTQAGRKNSNNSDDSLSTACEEEFEKGVDEDGSSLFKKKLIRSLNYGDIGRICFGKTGVALVNIPIVITQFGFCVAYYIFIGNTIQSMFPIYNCSVPVMNSSMPAPSGGAQQCFHVKSLNSLNAMSMDLTNLTEDVPGVLRHTRGLSLLSQHWQGHSPSPFPVATTSSGDMHGVGSYVNWSAHVGATGSGVTSAEITNGTTVVPPYTGNNTSISPTTLKSTTGSTTSSASTSPPHNTSMITTTTNTSTVSTSPPYNTTTPAVNTTSIPWSNITNWILVRGKHVPDLRLLVLTPVPVFIASALLRSLRTMGWISLIANAAILLGCCEVLYFLISGFVISKSFLWVDFNGIPIFFGLVTSSFEGIGTILPIEGSMEGNRHNFTKYLFGAVTVLASILSTFGTLGYMHFGHDIAQMVNANIPSGDTLNIFVNVSLCIGVLLTFPLMMFPVVELAEMLFFGGGGGCGCPCGSRDDGEEMKGEVQPLLPKAEDNINSSVPEGDKISSNVSGWKRNILRLLLVLFAAGLAVLLRNYFAYISAFVGALGSTMLAYILPCLFHLKLCWSRLPLPIKIKDITIIIIGITLGIAGMYSVLQEILS